MALDGFKKKLFKQLGIALGIIIVLSLFIFALSKDINSRADSITESHNELELRARTIDLLTGANGDLKKADDLLVKLQGLLPNKDQLIDFPRQLQSNAKLYAVDVGFSFGAERTATAKAPGAIRFTMTVAGTYDDVVDFMKYIEGHKYLINLDSIDVRRSTKDNFSLLTSGEIYTK